MRPRTWSWLVVLIVSGAIFAAPASAQTERAIPIVGGGSFGKAAPVTPGERYGDSVRPGETAFYRVELEAGQALKAEFWVPRDTHEFGDMALSDLDAKLFDAFRRSIMGDQLIKDAGNDVESETVAPTGIAGVFNEVDASGPGAWYIAVAASSSNGARDRFAIPFTFEVTVTNEDGTQATPAKAATPTSTPIPAATATAAPPRDREKAEGDGSPPVGVLGGAIGGGLLLGGIAGVGIRRRR